jgi:hypothetical protein
MSIPDQGEESSSSNKPNIRSKQLETVTAENVGTARGGLSPSRSPTLVVNAACQRSRSSARGVVGMKRCACDGCSLCAVATTTSDRLSAGAACNIDSAAKSRNTRASFRVARSESGRSAFYAPPAYRGEPAGVERAQSWRGPRGRARPIQSCLQCAAIPRVHCDPW